MDKLIQLKTYLNIENLWTKIERYLCIAWQLYGNTHLLLSMPFFNAILFFKSKLLKGVYDKYKGIAGNLWKHCMIDDLTEWLTPMLKSTPTNFMLQTYEAHHHVYTFEC